MLNMGQPKKHKLIDSAPLPPFAFTKEIKEKPGEFAANITWLQTNWENYKGVWVALDNGKLLCAGADRHDLESTTSTHPNRINIMSLKVGRDYAG